MPCLVHSTATPTPTPTPTPNPIPNQYGFAQFDNPSETVPLSAAPNPHLSPFTLTTHLSPLTFHPHPHPHPHPNQVPLSAARLSTLLRRTAPRRMAGTRLASLSAAFLLLDQVTLPLTLTLGIPTPRPGQQQ